jgi:hypothetical protein
MRTQPGTCTAYAGLVPSETAGPPVVSDPSRCTRSREACGRGDRTVSPRFTPVEDISFCTTSDRFPHSRAASPITHQTDREMELPEL